MNASPTSPKDRNSPVPFNSTLNDIIPHCYTPRGEETPGISPTNLKACQEALLILVHQPDFTTPFRFSANPRAMARKVPAGWQFGDPARCRIIVNCENNRDTAVFRYADIAQVARKVIDNCVDKPDPFGRFPLLRWGGIHGLTGQETFYVAVARPHDRTPEVGLANLTAPAGGGMVEEGSAVS